MATTTKTTKAGRPVRMWVRFTQPQADYIDQVANSTYRTPGQVVQMLLDQALLADGYRAEAGRPTALRAKADTDE